MIISFIVLIFSIVIHEVAHGTMAYQLGDDTAKEQGRLSLNPIKHIDPFGTILLPIILMVFGSPIIIGWAKPVPINILNLKDQRWGELKVALAGPLSNLFVALVCGLILRFIHLPEMMSVVLMIAVMYNILLALFNLIPVPPLDGSHILFSIIPGNYELKQFLSRYGGFILIAILLLIPSMLNWLYALVLCLTNLLIGV